MAIHRSESIILDTPAGRTVRVAMQYSSRARSLSLKFYPKDGSFVVVMPRGTPLEVADAFVQEEQAWILSQIDQAARGPAPDAVVVDDPQGASIAVAIRRHSRARHLRLKFAPADGSFQVVVPPHTSQAQVETFVREQTAWILAQKRHALTRVEFVDGATIPVLGEQILISKISDDILIPELEQAGGAGTLQVGGSPEVISNLVRKWLEIRAAEEIVPRAYEFAGRLDRKVSKLSIRDTRSRWGSCSSRGALSFSWRLVLAPLEVLVYVCAHETAHLVEMNHSARFWRLVGELVGDCQDQRDWLRVHGASLHRYG